jgi:hypothetical protein
VLVRAAVLSGAAFSGTMGFSSAGGTERRSEWAGNGAP